MANANNIISWEGYEKLVAFLELFLTPDAQVRHNVYLPVLGSPSNRTRQCDVVIEHWLGPRKSLTIVEVQKRKKKPTINEFQGWLEKMNDVGAQQLICVSELGYPKSVIEQAATRVGSRVALMTLKELEDHDPRPLTMLPGLVNPKRHITIIDAGFTEFSGITESISITCNSSNLMFTIDDNQEMISLTDFAKRRIDDHIHLFDNKNGIFIPQLFDIDILFTQKNPGSANPYPTISEVPHYVIVFSTDDHTVLMNYEHHSIRIIEGFIKLRLNIEYPIIDMPYSQFEYHQEFHDGILAWIATATDPLHNQDIQIIFKQDKQGILQISHSARPLSN